MEKKRSTVRERNKAEVRNRLIDTSLKLFLERGYENTTVEEITIAAGVSPRTFYRYFGSKDEVVFFNHEKRILLFRSLLADRSTSNAPFESVRSALLALSKYYADNALNLLMEFRIVTSSPELTACDLELDFEFENAIAEVLSSAGRPDEKADRRARIYAGAIFGAVRSTMNEWFQGECRDDLIVLGEEAIQIIGFWSEAFRNSAGE